ncbi:MAG: hypothetical protein KGJ59_02115 [Bacteroidota bacterium]|nr:hypothetical protein [Bacteroidota bacterium]
MNTIESTWKHLLLRAAVVSGVGILVGYIFYRSSVFNPHMRAFQFTVSSITAGIAYAMLKSPVPRNLWAALFSWYIILTGLLITFNRWMLILNLVYIIGVTVAIFVYNNVAAKPFLKRAVLRVAFAGAIIATTNGLIIIVLSLVSVRTVIVSHFTTLLKWVNLNMQFGAIIGLAVGIGIELAEYLDKNVVAYENQLQEESHGNNI